MFGVTAIATFIIIVLADFSNCQDYCKIPSCNPSGSHTLCKYRSAAAKCGNLGSGLKANERAEILARHNLHRQTVASGSEPRGSPGPQYAAKYMPNLTWDTELAKIAQRWADQCTFGHDKCRNVESYQVGQNVAQKGTNGDISKITYSSIVDLWYDEVAKYNRNAVSRFTGVGSGDNVVGHYTQLVWAKTTKLGCGSRTYKQGGFTNVYLVCNYGPSGNWQNEPVYEKR